MNNNKTIWEKFLDYFSKFTGKFEKIEENVKLKTGLDIPIGNIVGGIIIFICVVLFVKIVLGIIGHKLYTGDY